MSDYCGSSYIGLAINSNYLRAVVVEKEGKISALVEQPVDKPVLDGGTILEPEVFKQGLKQLAKKVDKLPACISVSLPEKYALTRELSFPAISEEEVAEAVRWQARNIFPLPISEMYLDWKQISENEEKREVFVVALPKRLIDDLVNILQELGFKPTNIQTSASAMARLIKSAPGRQHIIVNLNSDGITATLVTGIVAQLTATEAGIGKSEDELSRAAEGTIHKLLNFYEAKDETEVKVRKIFLTGEMASDKLKKKLTNEFKQPVEYLKLPVKFEDRQKLLTYSEAIAIALAPVEPPASARTINLLPGRIQDYYDSIDGVERVRRATAVFLSVVGLGFALLAGGYVYLFWQARTLSARIPSSGESEELLLDSSSAEVDRLNKEIDKFLILTEKKKTPRLTISLLPELLPEGVSLSTYEYNRGNKELTLKGKTVSRAALFKLESRLEEREEFSEVDLPLENVAQKANFEYKLTATLSD